VRVQTSGTVEQPNAMLSEDVIEKGYALMCVSTPTSDCTVEEITEAEILDEQLCA
jgi:ferredoxin